MNETERRQGVPILSDNIHGYFLPGNSAERDRCVRSLRRRAKEIESTAAAIERSEGFAVIRCMYLLHASSISGINEENATFSMGDSPNGFSPVSK